MVSNWLHLGGASALSLILAGLALHSHILDRRRRMEANKAHEERANQIQFNRSFET